MIFLILVRSEFTNMNAQFNDINPALAAENVRQYQLFDNVLKLREILIRENFWDQNTVNRFIEIFQQFIDILKADFDPIGYTINIKIKKTTVKKMPNYRAESIFYYNAIGNTMMILIKENKDRIIACLSNYYGNTLDIASIYEIYFSFIANVSHLYNLTNVQCISDNIVQIIL